MRPGLMGLLSCSRPCGYTSEITLLVKFWLGQGEALCVEDDG